MNYEVSVECLWCAASCRMDSEVGPSLLDAFDTRVETHIDPGVARTFHQPAYKVDVERLEHALGTLNDGDLGAGARRDMRNLSGDIAAADQHDPLWQLAELEKFGARDKVLLAGQAQAGRNRAHCDENETGVELVNADGYGVRITESRAAVISIDAFLGEAAFHHGGHWSSEGSLEPHQFAPSHRGLPGHALALHAVSMVDRLRCAD